MEEVKHAKYAPSSMSRLVSCPMSAYISEGIKDEPPSTYALEGSYAHGVAEYFLKKHLSILTPEDKLPKPPYCVDGADHTVAELHAQSYVDYVSRVINKYSLCDNAFYIEKRLTLNKNCWGTADFVLVSECKHSNEKSAVIEDYKYGMGIQVSPEHNWQLATYAYALYNMLAKKDFILDKITLSIFQPRTIENNGVIEQEVTYPVKDLQPLWQQIQETINSIDLAFKNQDPSILKHEEGPHCRFCKAKSICSKYEATTKQAALELLQLACKSLPKKRNLVDIKAILTPEQIAFLTLNRTFITNLVDDVSSIASDILINGGSLPGCKLIEATKSRKWIKDEALVASGLMSLGLEDPYTKKILSLTQAEKILGKGECDHLLADLSLEPPTYKVVDETSKGDAVNKEQEVSSMLAASCSSFKASE